MITIEVDYKTHKYTEQWDKEPDVFCPHCGKQEVWAELSEGDYYEGPTHLCAGCGAMFLLPRITTDLDDPDKQRLAAIRRAKNGCNRRLAEGQHWAFCGETDMGQSAPALCTECGGEFKLA